MKAWAVVFTDKLKVLYTEVTAPDPESHDVVVDTHYSWISNGTEGSFLRGERSSGERPYLPGEPWPFPIAPGYQSVGIVERVGSGVTDVRPGDWVFCTLGRIEGMFEPWGGHISPKVVDRSQVWRIPRGVSPVALSGLVLTQVGFNCATRPPMAAGDRALVIGDGLVGQWAAQTLHWRGATVILAGKHDDRLGFFAGRKRRRCVNVLREDLARIVQDVAPSGVNVLVDTVGSVPLILACLPMIAHDGHIVSAGFHGKDSLLDIQQLRNGEWTLHSPSGWQRKRMDKTLELIAAGRLETERLITHRFPVKRAAEAWDLIVNRTEPVLGVLLTWR